MILVFAVTISLATASPSAKSLFDAAVVRIHSIRPAPFLKYDYHLRLVHGAKSKSYAYRVLERLADHVGRFVSIEPGGSDSQDISVHRALVSPALFLNAVDDAGDRSAEGVSSQTAPPTIAEVVSSPYDVTFDGTEAEPDGTSTNKLKLVPRSAPDVHQLRELWLDSATGGIRRATLLKTVAIISPEPTLFDLDLDASGFVTRWSFAGTGHIAFFSYALEAEGTFANLAPVVSADAKLFR